MAYIYEKQEDNIHIFELIPNLEKIKEYKEQEMKKIPFAEMLYRAKTNDRCILNVEDVVSLTDINYRKGRKFHQLILDNNKSMLEISRLMTNYFNGEYANSNVVKIVDENSEVVKYLLVPFYYTQINLNLSKPILASNYLISIPKSLYLLQLLELGRYDLLIDENVDKQLSMFELDEKLSAIISTKDARVSDVQTMILNRIKKN